VQAPLEKLTYRFLPPFFFPPFFAMENPPSPALGCENSSTRYRVASAAWHVSSHVTERLASVLTLFAPDASNACCGERERSQKKRGCVV